MVEKAVPEFLKEIESLKKSNLELKSTLKINEDNNFFYCTSYTLYNSK